MVLGKDTIGIILPVPKLNIKSWLNGLSLGGF